MMRPRSVSDAEILVVARRCFLAHGPAVSTAVIAAEAGLSQAALFKRFARKEELMIAALLPEEAPDWLDAIEAGPDTRPLDAQLVEICTVIGRSYAAIIPCLMTLKASGVDLREVLRTRYQVPPPLRAREAMKAWFERARAAGNLGPADPDGAALLLLGAVHQHSFLTHIGDAPPREGWAEVLVDTLWRGIRPARAEKPS